MPTDLDPIDTRLVVLQQRAAARVRADAADPARAARRQAAAGKLRSADVTSVAATKVEGLPAQGAKGFAAVPFDYCAHPPFKLTKASFRGAQHGKVPLSTLVATQPVVKRNKVLKDVKTKGAFGEYPTILCLSGKNYIVDGHHRATAAWALGMDHMRANILHADDGE